MILHHAKRSGGFSSFAGRIPPCHARRRPTGASRAVNTAILFCSLLSRATRSPPVNRSARRGLKRGFRPTVEHAFRRAVGNKNDVSWLEQFVRPFAREYLAQVHWNFGSLSRSWVR